MVRAFHMQMNRFKACKNQVWLKNVAELIMICHVLANLLGIALHIVRSATTREPLKTFLELSSANLWIAISIVLATIAHLGGN